MADLTIAVEMQGFMAAQKEMRALAKVMESMKAGAKAFQDIANAAKQVQSAVTSADKALQSAATQASALASALGKVKANQVGRAPSSSGGGSGGGSSANSFLNGPAQRLQAALDNKARARVTGTNEQNFDANIALLRAHSAMTKAQQSLMPKTFGSALKSALLSSRVSMSANSGLQLMPLVTKLASAFGPEVTAIVLAAGALGFALAGMTEAATKAAKEFNAIRLTSGGTQSEAGQLKTLGAITGIDMGAASRSFAENTRNGIAAGEISRLGIRPNYGPFDTTNQAAPIIQYIKQLQKMTEEQRIRSTRITGQEGLLPFFNLPKEAQERRLGRDAKLSSDIFDPKFQKESAAFADSISHLQEALLNLGTAVIKPLVPVMTKVFNGIAEAINWLADFFNQHQNTLAANFKLIFDMVAGNIINLPGDLKGIVGGFNADAKNAKKAKDPLINALDKNADATAGLNATMNGIFGGGERARNAIPRAWTGQNMNPNNDGVTLPGGWIKQAATLGAFQL